MTEELRKLLAGFAKLTPADRRAFLAIIQRTGTETANLNEELRKSEQITMGPLGGGCPCCGRS